MNARSTINLDTYGLSLLTAKEDIINPRSSTNWALFSYDGISNKLKLADSGAGGMAELAEKFDVSKPQYGLCRMGSTDTGSPWIAMICWVGQNVDEFRKAECCNHLSAVKNFFKEAHAFIRAEKVEDVTEERIKAELSKAQASAPTHWIRRSSRSADKEEIVGTNYRKTNAAMEMRRINRDFFWARAEREEDERKEAERRRAVEERRRLERERVLTEQREAEERDRKMNEKLQMIEEQRRKQAEQDEELRRKEKSRWEQQQREHEEDMRARLRRSESIEKAAEAAVLVSQRSMNPREFFRQLSSSSSLSPTSPGSSRTGKPFRRYQRSLTDTAFIFSKAEENAATSPLVSPFSRTPPSPLFRATSPSASADLHPVASPQRLRAVSPPASPLQPAAPVSAVPSVPSNNSQVQDAVEPKAPSPTEPSAPPASPTLLAAFSHNSLKSSQPIPEAMPPSPPNTPSDVQLEEPTFCFETAELDSNVKPELICDTGFKVQAVLIEEDEDEDVQEEEEDDKCETQPQPCAVTTEPIQPEEEEQEQEELSEQKADSSPPEESGEVVTREDREEEVTENIQTEDSQAPAECVLEKESAVTEAEDICQQLKQDTVVLVTNGMTNGEDTAAQNGIERSLSPSDTEMSSPDVPVCHVHHDKVTEEEEDVAEDEQEGVPENGQMVLAEAQMCVRALYDYQAGLQSFILCFKQRTTLRSPLNQVTSSGTWKQWTKPGGGGGAKMAGKACFPPIM
ncbi:drebrin isoform X2 [Thalassophryne amazonica]|uniref:drebrin isoform X2 n=1 Tax=Thalassophryne amazonica TaxID=390379 RepID=UPI001471151B|nr:drebrin isoform X2 [Thalassophryne amazonica]